MAANSATKLFRKSSFQQLSILTIGQLSFICEGWRFWPKSRHHWCTTQWGEWHSCETLSSGLREASYWPKNGLRSNLIAPKFQNLSGGAFLCAHCQPDQSKSDGYSPDKALWHCNTYLPSHLKRILRRRCFRVMTPANLQNKIYSWDYPHYIRVFVTLEFCALALQHA